MNAYLLHDLFQPILNIKLITGQLIGQCQKMGITGITKTKVFNPLVKNLPPVFRKPNAHYSECRRIMEMNFWIV